jgi:hypothetical protein
VSVKGHPVFSLFFWMPQYKRREMEIVNTDFVKCECGDYIVLGSPCDCKKTSKKTPKKEKK